MTTPGTPTSTPIAQPPSLAAQAESILYAAAEPVSVSSLAVALEASVQDVETALAEITGACVGRGVRLQRQGNMVQLVTAPENAERVQKFLGLEAQNRLSSAALETLAIIAFKQPITRPQIEVIRGVNCDGVMKTLEQHNLIQELGRTETVGRPMRYGVSFDFLQHFGLGGVHELPTIENLDSLPSSTDTDSASSDGAPPDGASQPDSGAGAPPDGASQPDSGAGATVAAEADLQPPAEAPAPAQASSESAAGPANGA